MTLTNLTYSKSLTKVPYTAARLYREIKEQGYQGGENIVKDFVRKVRPEQGVPAVLRYETKLGVQVHLAVNHQCEPVTIIKDKYIITVVYWYESYNYFT